MRREGNVWPGADSDGTTEALGRERTATAPRAADQREAAGSCIWDSGFHRDIYAVREVYVPRLFHVRVQPEPQQEGMLNRGDRAGKRTEQQEMESGTAVRWNPKPQGEESGAAGRRVRSRGKRIQTCGKKSEPVAKESKPW